MSTMRTRVPEYPYCLWSICLSVRLPACLSVCTFICVFLSYSFKLSLDGTNTYHGTVKGHSQIFDGYKMTVRSQTEVKVQNSNVVLGNTVLYFIYCYYIVSLSDNQILYIFCIGGSRVGKSCTRKPLKTFRVPRVSYTCLTT